MTDVAAQCAQAKLRREAETARKKAAQLELERVPGRCLCSHCGQAFHPCDQIHACPRCGRISGQVLAGRELELVALEVS